MEWASTKHNPEILNAAVSPGRVYLALIVQSPHRLDLRRYIRFTQTTDRISDRLITDRRRQFGPSRGRCVQTFTPWRE